VERQCASSGLLEFEESRHKQMQTSTFSMRERTPGRSAGLFDLIERLGNELPEAPMPGIPASACVRRATGAAGLIRLSGKYAPFGSISGSQRPP